MRRSLAALCLLAFVTPTSAQDFDVPALRGTSPFIPAAPKYTRWAGVYAGGQIGYARAGVDFGGGVTDLVSYITRNSILEPIVPNWTTLPRGDTASSSIGGFIGYNYQFDDVIFGFEANYSHTSLHKGVADSISRIIQDDSNAPPGHHFFYDVSVDANASVRITDLMTFRGRAAWIYRDRFLPYAFGGLAVARADTIRSATVTSLRTDVPDVTDPVTPVIPPVLFGPNTQAENKTGGFYFGYTAGLGMDVLIMPNVFVRGEWEFIQLPSVQDLKININTVRTGLGLKF